MPRRPRLSEAEQRQLLRRYLIGRRNRPEVIAADFGINKSTLGRYVRKLLWQKG